MSVICSTSAEAGSARIFAPWQQRTNYCSRVEKLGVRAVADLVRLADAAGIQITKLGGNGTDVIGTITPYPGGLM